MSKSIAELIIGDLEGKRAYRNLMKRVGALPKDYRFAFKKLQHYMYCFGSADSNMSMFVDLVELFETSATEGKRVIDVIGSDVSGFCDDLIQVSTLEVASSAGKLNQEIMEHFHRGGKS